MKNLKRKAIVAVLAFLMLAGAPAWAAFCSISLSGCPEMVCLPIPPGGWCSKSQGAESAHMIIYDSTGAIVHNVFISCPNSIVQLPNEP